MYLRKAARDTFILLQGDQPAGQARQLIERLDCTHVIVCSTDPPHAYYLYPKREIVHLLAHAGSQITAQQAIGLHKATATPALDAYTDAEATPDRSVVVEEGHVIGFFDATELPDRPVMRGGSWETSKGGEPAPRSLVADLPRQVHLDESVSLLVWLSAELEAGSPLPATLPAGAAVDIVVQPGSGFELDGKSEGTLRVTVARETMPLQFKLRATQIGPAKLRVFAFYQGQPLGCITLATTVVPATQPASGQRTGQEQVLERLSASQPDLSLLILEHDQAGKPAITFRLTALDPGLELNLKPFGPVQLHMDPFQYFQEFFHDIETLPLRTPREKAAAELRLAARGAGLFQALFPPDLQALLWSLRDQVRTVQVQSEEPWIPWELCKLQGKENGRVDEGPFLCEAFAVTRWMPGVGRKHSLRMNRIALVTPRDSGLRHAASERDYLLSLAGSGRRIEPIPANYLDVRSALAAGKYDCWHFTGHGGVRSPDPNRSAILLENRDMLIPEDLYGVVGNLGQAHPIVFLNACQVGRSAMSLTDIGGWAAQFLRAGAAAFIGAYWSVFDQPACDFAQAFYARLLAEVPIGEAVRQARASIKPSGDPTWLAYTVFADPLAAIARNDDLRRR
jgi:hypothetical protein